MVAISFSLEFKVTLSIGCHLPPSGMFGKLKMKWQLIFCKNVKYESKFAVRFVKMGT